MVQVQRELIKTQSGSIESSELVKQVKEIVDRNRDKAGS